MLKKSFTNGILAMFIVCPDKLTLIFEPKKTDFGIMQAKYIEKLQKGEIPYESSGTSYAISKN